MPAPKKEASARRRRNVAATSATLTRDHDVEVPELPASRVWDPMTVQWWEDIWASPMAPEWDDSDRHGLFVLAGLVDDFWRAESPTARKEAATEIRLQRQAFGLTPYDRRRLEWTIEQADDAKAKGAKRRQGGQPKEQAKPTGADPRSVLRAV